MTVIQFYSIQRLVRANREYFQGISYIERYLIDPFENYEVFTSYVQNHNCKDWYTKRTYWLYVSSVLQTQFDLDTDQYNVGSSS
jgi:hypothetical protein